MGEPECMPLSQANLRTASAPRSFEYPEADRRDNMQPLQDLLNRITWDPEFTKDRFAIGYEDRLMAQVMVAPFTAVRLDPERPGMLSVQQEDGSIAHIPLHRVRTVYKNGEAIWRRPPRIPRG